MWLRDIFLIAQPPLHIQGGEFGDSAMRTWVFVSIVVLIAFSLVAAAQNSKGTIQGVVVRAGTGQPLKGVRISLQRSASQQAGPGAVAPVITDASGKFVMTALDASQYRIFAE